jgi:hypothetical protein
MMRLDLSVSPSDRQRFISTSAVDNYNSARPANLRKRAMNVHRFIAGNY